MNKEEVINKIASEVTFPILLSSIHAGRNPLMDDIKKIALDFANMQFETFINKEKDEIQCE